jgi:hypothetical protein
VYIRALVPPHRCHVAGAARRSVQAASFPGFGYRAQARFALILRVALADAVEMLSVVEQHFRKIGQTALFGKPEKQIDILGVRNSVR